jgi:hypothetical protein
VEVPFICDCFTEGISLCWPGWAARLPRLIPPRFTPGSEAMHLIRLALNIKSEMLDCMVL